MNKPVSKEVASKAMDSWLDYKKVSPRKRESNKDSIESITSAFEDGALSLDENTKEIVMHLAFGIGKDESVKEIKFRPRLNVGLAHKHLQGKKGSDADARILAFVCALTGQNSGVIAQMDTEDYSVAQSIAVFFF